MSSPVLSGAAAAKAVDKYMKLLGERRLKRIADSVRITPAVKAKVEEDLAHTSAEPTPAGATLRSAGITDDEIKDQVLGDTTRRIGMIVGPEKAQKMTKTARVKIAADGSFTVSGINFRLGLPEKESAVARLITGDLEKGASRRDASVIDDASRAEASRLIKEHLA